MYDNGKLLSKTNLLRTVKLLRKVKMLRMVLNLSGGKLYRHEVPLTNSRSEFFTIPKEY